MSRLVARARTHIGVPYRHLGRTAQHLDCAGLPWLSYAEEGVALPDLKKYGRTPFDDGLMRAVEDALGAPVWVGSVGRVVSRALLQVGDVVAMRFVKEPHHLAIVGDDAWHGLSLIHADGTPQAGPHGRMLPGKVVEHGLTDHFLAMIAAVFRRPL
ncbi:NlpC/P60 family protein [Variovorax sp. RT4R15]|uniref:NlpC/P60 family protein n=1 Tax=Variovorax sp. RT4R15 TaxID=3443737 RepID=UPI003F449259